MVGTGTTTFDIKVVSPRRVSHVGVFRTAGGTVLSTVRKLDPGPSFLLTSTMGLLAPCPVRTVVGKSNGDVSVTTTSVVTGIAESEVVTRVNGRFPRCKFRGGVNCKAGRRLRTVALRKVSPCRQGDFTPVGGLVDRVR